MLPLHHATHCGGFLLEGGPPTALYSLTDFTLLINSPVLVDCSEGRNPSQEPTTHDTKYKTTSLLLPWPLLRLTHLDERDHLETLVSKSTEGVMLLRTRLTLTNTIPLKVPCVHRSASRNSRKRIATVTVVLLISDDEHAVMTLEA